jgi:hypothetical protein
MCGTRLPPLVHEIVPRDDSRWQADEGRAVDDDQTKPGVPGKAVFWLGIVALDVLFVLFVLWLFVPSLVISQRMFSGTSWPLGIVALDVGIGCILVGNSFMRWA